MITIRCIAESGIASEAIEFRSLSQFSHTEFCLPNGYLGSRLNGGVQIRPLDYCTPVREAILTVVLDPEDEAKIMSWAHAQIGDSYGWKQVIDVALNEEAIKPSGLDCSEFVSKALAQADFMVSRKPFYATTPADVYNNTQLNLVSDTAK